MPKRKIGYRDTIDIVGLHIEGKTNAAIGERYGITQQAVHRILKKPQIKMLKEKMLNKLTEERAARIHNE